MNIKDKIIDIKRDVQHLLYDVSSLIGYIQMNWDDELPDNDYWSKKDKTELYKKTNKFLEKINDAIYAKEYGETRETDIINEIEAIYFRMTNKKEKPKDTKPFIENKKEDDENEEEEVDLPF